MLGDFFEIDFLYIDSDSSCDAITCRYRLNGRTYIHVVDAGFDQSADQVINFINHTYDNPTYIDHVVATHQDRDHTGGLKRILEEYHVGTLWMLKPWDYAHLLIHQFKRFTSVGNLVVRLKQIYSNIADLDQIAQDRGVIVREPFQGTQIGIFTVLSPSPDFYYQMILESDKTPEAKDVEASDLLLYTKNRIAEIADRLIQSASAMWGHERFSSEETSAENETSVIQVTRFLNDTVLLTGDAGRRALTQAYRYAPHVGLSLPGIQVFQVPHHGSRRNLSSPLLDAWLGPKAILPVLPGGERFYAFCCASSKDKDHPRKAVIRGLMHRGAMFATTEHGTKTYTINAPHRAGYGPIFRYPYPHTQEE